MTRWTLREKGVVVAGHKPTTFIGIVTPNELRREIKDTLVGWGTELLRDHEAYNNRFYQSFLVLNYCRMLQDLHQGKVTSKLDGVVWAKSNLDKKWIPLIDFCWSERLDTEISVHQPANPEVFHQSIKFVEYAVRTGESYKVGS